MHRLVAQYFCNDFTKEKEVHHINKNRADNRAENLTCMSKAEHLKLHKKNKREGKDNEAAEH